MAPTKFIIYQHVN